jgi:hypothetical protein
MSIGRQRPTRVIKGKVAPWCVDQKYVLMWCIDSTSGLRREEMGIPALDMLVLKRAVRGVPLGGGLPRLHIRYSSYHIPGLQHERFPVLSKCTREVSHVRRTSSERHSEI